MLLRVEGKAISVIIAAGLATPSATAAFMMIVPAESNSLFPISRTHSFTVSLQLLGDFWVMEQRTVPVGSGFRVSDIAPALWEPSAEAVKALVVKGS